MNPTGEGHEETFYRLDIVDIRPCNDGLGPAQKVGRSPCAYLPSQDGKHSGGPKLATVSGSNEVSLEGRIVAANPTENSFVIEKWNNQKRFAIPLNSKTKLSADKGIQLAGSKPVFGDFKPGQLVKVTYTFGPTVLEVRLRRDKSDGKAKPAPTSNEKKSPDPQPAKRPATL
jgi:hypothetical protein